MPIELRILTGARAGQSDYFEKDVISIGRHPTSDFLLDIKKDLDVSRRHGEIRFVGNGYRLYDKDSTNGTYLNDEQLPPGGNRDLADGDTIKLGGQGPMVTVVITGAGEPRTPSAAPAAEPRVPKGALAQRLRGEDHGAHAVHHAPVAHLVEEPRMVEAPRLLEEPQPVEPPVLERDTSEITGESALDTTLEPPPVVDAPERQPTSERVAIAVKQQTRMLWVVIIVAVIVLGGLAASVFWFGRRETASRDAEIQQLLASNEQLTRQFQTRLQATNDTGLTNAMQRRLDSLSAVARDARDDKSAAAAEAQLRANHALQSKLNAMDLPAVRDANDPAVTLIVSEINGRQKEATGFAVTIGGLIITNRHVLTDTMGAQASKILVKFANTREWRHAHLVKFDDNASVDLALIQVDEPGPYPAVRGIAPSVDTRVGAPVATIGYPLGTDVPMEGPANDFAAKTTLTIGTVSKAVSDVLQIDSFASHGSSGSPVIDEHGHVIGVVWGGPPSAAGRIVYAVPADRIASLVKAIK